jgi:hypothetical protein
MVERTEALDMCVYLLSCILWDRLFFLIGSFFLILRF